MIDFMQPHQTTVAYDQTVQGQLRSQQQRVEFYGRSDHIVELSSISFVPPFTMSKQTESNKPVKSFRFRGITASIFENQSEDGKSTFYKVTLQRSYRQDDEWKSTNSFGRDDLPIVGLLTNQAWEFILNTESNGQKEEK